MDDRLDGAQPTSRFFPMQVLKCCPSIVQSLIPATWHHVQDTTHLMILMGSVASVVILIINARSVLADQCPNSAFCHREVLALLAVVPNLGYFCRMLGQYDQAIMVRQQEIMRRRQEVVDSYEQLVTDIDGLLGKSSESSALLAEGGFESKRRDFIRFLERIEDQGSIQVVDDALLEEFRKFVLHWLKVFSECSVDPVGNPYAVVDDDELARFGSMGEIASFVKDRLKGKEVKFITNHKDEDAKLLRGIKKTHKRMSAMDANNMITDIINGGEEIELVTLSNSPADLGSGNRTGQGNTGGAGLIPQSRPQGKKSCLSCQWCSFHKAGCLVCFSKGPEGGDGFPRVTQCFCSELVLLSAVHALLIGTFVASCAYFGALLWHKANFGATTMTWIDLAGIVIYMVALLAILVNFEQIDIIQKLESEIGALKEESKELATKQTKMVGFWEDVQGLTDVWVYRTSPRLELMKEVHVCLENIQTPADMKAALTNTNQRIDHFESQLPAIELWRHGGNISDSAKKTFAKQIKNINEKADRNLAEILSGISQVTGEAIPALTN